MRLIAHASARTMRLVAACASLVVLASISTYAQDDPPDQAGRVSWISGSVSVQTAGSDDWGQAYQNLPLGPGDRIYSDQDGRAEIQVGQSYVRIGPNTDITLVNYAPDSISFGVGQGAVHVRSFGFWQGQALDVSTPNGDGRLDQPGEFRADVMPDQGASIFTSLGSEVLVSGAGQFEQPVSNWQSLELAGINPVYPQWLQPGGPDDLDAWSRQRDQQIINSNSYRFLSPEIGGAADLDANGDWIPDSDYGPIWFPRNVQADWQPYRYGHWLNREPWGWVWVEDEPWGYAPFHYGRWVSYQGRWGWIPGAREQHPVWSPALVVFAGGINVGGVGVSAWFPLGPGEPYRPWYPCSPRYIDRVNISNIRESRVIHVQTTYVNIVNVTNVTNITYVNRSIGVTAMRQDDFAAGRGARQAAVTVDRRQFDHVQVIDRPAPVTRQSIIARPVAHPVPVAVTRPTFINHQGMQITAKPGAPPQAPPVRPVQTVKTLPGRTVVPPPAGSKIQTQQPVRAPIAPGVTPIGKPEPPTNSVREGNPNQPPAQNPVRPTGRPAYQPPVQTVAKPAPTPPGKPETNPNTPPPTPPSGKTTPSETYKQDFGPVQPTKRQTEVPPPSQPPANNPPPPARPPAAQPAQPPPPAAQPAKGNESQPPPKPSKDKKDNKKDDNKKDN